ncbi:unnamed protein product [Dovyalis caffra]|uniref:Uncharacterized protein n=1 Tax=Dovyalis caffra TaxID=77055 RepID=A0AAV1S985_9ROSI|nr:unnamed protein product [Dovyalis caffra]
MIAKVRSCKTRDPLLGWLKLLLSRICLDEIHFPRLFSKSHYVGNSENGGEVDSSENPFSTEQTYLLNVLSKILSDRLREITIPHDFALSVFGILKKSVDSIDFASGGETGLPTGSAVVDVLGYLLTNLEDTNHTLLKCAMHGRDDVDEDSVDVDTLLYPGFLELPFGLLHDLETTAKIKKAMRQADSIEKTTAYNPKLCTYKGFRRDIVAVIDNCLP